MGNVTHYPAQKLTVTGAEINLVQSADVDFSISRQDVFEFGNVFAVDNIQVEPPTVTLNYSYAIATGSNNHVKIGLNDLETTLANVAGRDFKISGAGSLDIKSGIVTSYSVEGSIGNIPTASVSIQAVDAIYTAGEPSSSQVGTIDAINVARPDQIQITFNGTEYECRSFSYTLDIPRQTINKLGQIDSIATILNGPPKVTVEAEVILRNNANPKFGTNDPQNVVISMGTISFGVTGAKLSSFTSNTSLDDIQVASITLEAGVKNQNHILIGA